MAELTAQKITESVKKGKKDPRMTKDLEFKQDSYDPEFLKKLRCGMDYWHILTIGELELPVRLLSIKETMDVLKETQQWFNELPELQKLPDLWVKRQAVSTLLKALNSTPDDKEGHKYYVSLETLERLEDRIFITIFNAYSDLCEKFDASLDDMSDAEYKSVVGDLEGKPALVKNLSRLRLEQIVIRLLQDAISLKDSYVTLLSQKHTTITPQ